MSFKRPKRQEYIKHLTLLLEEMFRHIRMLQYHSHR